MDDMDEATAALILQLQLEDSKSLSDEIDGKGKGRAGVLSDSHIALQLRREELERSTSLLSDRAMTQSIARACIAHGPVLSASRSVEQTAASDRESARRLGGRAALPVNRPRTVTPEALDDDTIAALAALYLPGDTNSYGAVPTRSHFATNDEAGESSAWAASRTGSNNSSKRECTICLDHVDFYNTARLSCGDSYCRTCLQDLFNASMVDESLFPPRCCHQVITPESFQLFLTSEIVEQYEAKKVEFGTVERIYCSNPECSIFLPAANIQGELATCPACVSLTCTMCKAASHDGDCPADTGLQMVLYTAEQEGWKRCYKCRRLVELDYGCNHITCTCRAEFCYLCGLVWKTCRCAQWNEDRLLARGQQIAARGPGGPGGQQHVDAVVNNLRQRHNCHHRAWRRVQGEYRCEQCRQDMPDFIFECAQCELHACKRCKLNRL